MRYRDWDTLIFAQGTNVPIQEFRTSSFLVQEGNIQTPTLVTYIPSLLHGTPFNISLHNWAEPQLGAGLGHFQHYPGFEGFAWGVRLVVDGITVSSATFSEQATWPQVFDNTTPNAPRSKSSPLLFPAFDRAVLSRRDWNISDNAGRIKVVIAEGLKTGDGSTTKFRPVKNEICFSFQPAPLEYLERCNIAWPNSIMYANPWRSSQLQHSHGAIATNVSVDKCSYSQEGRLERTNDSFFARAASAMPAPPAPSYKPFTATSSHPFPEMQSWSSRSTSVASEDGLWADFGSKSGISALDGPALVNNRTRAAKSTIVRLPSDQLRQIITAIGHNNIQDSQTCEVTTKPGKGTPIAVTNTLAGPCFSFKHIEDAENMKTNRDRTTSDITMHKECAHFPACTSDDPESGQLVHKIPASGLGPIPAEAVAAEPVPVVEVTLPTPSATDSESDKWEPSRSANKKRCRSPLSNGNLRDDPTSVGPSRKVSRHTLPSDHTAAVEKENECLMIL